MGNLRFAAAILFVAACGNDHAQTVDAAVDSKMIDAKVWMDAPPPTYDLSCYGMQPGTTVAAMITLTGTVGELSQAGISGLGGKPVTAYKVGSTAPAASAVSSVVAGSEGEFTLGPITTNGDAIQFVKAQDTGTTYRTTYLYPPNPIRASFDGLPVPMIDQGTVDQLAIIGDQDDSVNGLIFIAVNDCSTTMPAAIDGASVSVKQNNQDVGTVFDVGQFIPEAAGTFIVLNVPDGDTQVSASYNGMNFPTHTVRAYKKPNGPNAMGTVTVTAIPPGPIN
jgi:hypothetical protein